MERTKEVPPRVHQLARLAEHAGLEPGEEQVGFLRELSAYYVQTRYPDEVPVGGGKLTRRESGEVVKKTQEVIRWIESTQ